MSNKFFYPSMIKIIMHLKLKNNNIRSFARNIKMNWGQVKSAVELLYMYGFLELDKQKGITYFNLTKDGKDIQYNFLVINSIIQKNKQNMLVGIHGYKDKEELLNDIEGDIR